MINVGKTVTMSLHSKQNRFPIQPKITFRNMDIAYNSESKLLGIHITENTKWNAHVRSTSLKLKCRILLNHLQKL